MKLIRVSFVLLIIVLILWSCLAYYMPLVDKIKILSICGPLTVMSIRSLQRPRPREFAVLNQIKLITSMVQKLFLHSLIFVKDLPRYWSAPPTFCLAIFWRVIVSCIASTPFLFVVQESSILVLCTDIGVAAKVVKRNKTNFGSAHGINRLYCVVCVCPWSLADMLPTSRRSHDTASYLVMIVKKLGAVMKCAILKCAGYVFAHRSVLRIPQWPSVFNNFF